jgi:hypothetical protein
MNCPFHVAMYKDGYFSYRDLPKRWAELGTVYRCGQPRTRGSLLLLYMSVNKLAVVLLKDTVMHVAAPASYQRFAGADVDAAAAAAVWCCRYERSGTMHGLFRVRGFTQDDAHIFCLPEQIEPEIRGVLDLVQVRRWEKQQLGAARDWGFVHSQGVCVCTAGNLQWPSWRRCAAMLAPRMHIKRRSVCHQPRA